MVNTKEELEIKLKEKNLKYEWNNEDGICITSEKKQIFKIVDGVKEVMFFAAESSVQKKVNWSRPFKALINDVDSMSIDEEIQESLEFIGDFGFEHSTRIPWQKHDIIILNK